MSCIFCKIVAKEIPCHRVYEDDQVLAFLDISPCSPGHTVVIPKHHFENIEALNMEQWQMIAVGLKNTADQINSILKPAGMNVGLNNNPAAGQAVPHLHWHIIPRYEKDHGGSMHSIVRYADDRSVADIGQLFA